MRKLATPFLLLVGFAGVLPAQDGSSTTALSYTAKPDPPPDYSRERLVQMFHDIDIGANPRGLSPFDGLVIIQTRTFTLLHAGARLAAHPRRGQPFGPLHARRHALGQPLRAHAHGAARKARQTN